MQFINRKIETFMLFYVFVQTLMEIFVLNENSEWFKEAIVATTL
jgi:hypothetical protein